MNIVGFFGALNGLGVSVSSHLGSIRHAIHTIYTTAVSFIYTSLCSFSYKCTRSKIRLLSPKV